nr:hypothetical protein [Tanacetum cinerariifolium]
PPAGLAAVADELSPTSYLGPRAISNLFLGCKVTSGLSSLRLAEGSSSGSSSSSSSGCISKSDSGTYSDDWVIGEASSAYGWSLATISSSACSGPGI